MIVRITELERGSRETRSGDEQEGLYVRGLKMDQQGNFNDEYEKFLSEQFDGDFIQMIENFGVGSELNLSFVKKGAFWNLDSVTDNKARNKGGGSNKKSSKKETPKSAPKQPTPAPGMSEGPIKFVSTPKQIRTTSLSLAVDIVKTGVKLQSINEKFKLFPLKTTPELLSQTILGVAEKVEEYINSAKLTKPEKKKESFDGEEPVPVPEDEIPF